MLTEFTEWLNGTKLSLAFKTTSWLIPVSQSVHILCVAVVMSAVLLTSLRVLGVSARHHPLSSFRGRFLPWVWAAYAVLLFTGALQIIAEPGRALPNPFFQAKMALFLIMVLITLAFQRGAPPLGVRDGATTLARGLSIATVVLLLAIIVCGRWIAYTDRI